MPSPGKIPRFFSDSQLSETHEFRPSKKSQHSDSGSNSTSSLKTAWKQKVGHFITRKMDSELTEETLEKFNKRNEELEERRNSNCHSQKSPYYKGLLFLDTQKIGTHLEAGGTTPHTPCTVSPYYKGLNAQNPTSPPRERTPPPASTSPGRESHVGSTFSSSSVSSFTAKIQEFGRSCFQFGSKEQKGTRIIKVYSTKETSNKEKPLRERVSEQAAPVAPPQTSSAAKSSLVSVQEEPISPTRRIVLNAKDINETKEEKYFWADKYRPEALSDFICNKDKALELQTIVKAKDCRHFIFEGPPGVGKRTMIWAVLREAFGPDKIQAREECKEFDLKGEAVSSIIVNVKESSQHVEVNLSELKGYEKQVIVELIKETNKRLVSKAMQCTHDNCRAIILYEADKLSTDALLYIRWLLERYRGCNKVFFCCNDASKLQPVIPLCSIIQLVPPSDDEIIEVLEFISKNEGIDLPYHVAAKIAAKSKNNLRQAIRSFEATWRSNSLLKEDPVIMTGWEEDIAEVAKNIVEKQSPKQLYDIRRKLQKLIEHSVSHEFIYETLLEELKKNVDSQVHTHIRKLDREYKGRENDERLLVLCRRKEDIDREHGDPLRQSIHHFMKIEEFIAKFMSYYKGWLANKGKGEDSNLEATTERKKPL